MIRIEDNKIHIGDLLKIFFSLGDGAMVEKLTPSRYVTEMQMSVEQRLNLLNDRSRTQKIGQQNKIWTIPDIVVFQNFEKVVLYSTEISFTHQKSHPMRIKVLPDLSPCFIMHESSGTVYSKLAPGTPHKITLQFFSEDHRDYLSFIQFEAEGDVCRLPVVALAPKPLPLFPDVIEIPEAPVNITADKRVFMRNSGGTSLVFKLKAQLPFCVCPKTGVLEPDAVLDVKVSYKNCRAQENVSDLIISFGGIDLYTKLICEAKNCELFLDKTILCFEDTFLSLKRCLHLKLINKSMYTMKYQWKQFETKYAEMEKCEEYRRKLKDVNEYEVLRNIQEENPNITDAELHKTFIDRIYSDELAEFDSTDQFLFHDENFSLLETSGTIGPHSTINIEVVFCPHAADTFVRWAYLDVTGRETRQPLKIAGTGLGPVVCLHSKLLDVENLYLCAKHQYEIVAKNEGIVPATLTYCHKSMDFGGSMKCTPSEVFIDPGICEKMVLDFSSTVQGKFQENLNFKIMESGEYINLVVRGNIICPLLTYDVEQVDFGTVAFGFAVEKEISMQNSTEVPIEFIINILNDGVNEAITWVNFSMNHDARLVSSTPKEFNVYPEEATVEGNSSVTIKITLIANKVRKHSTFLQTYMWGSKKHYAEIPISYNCVVPHIECIPPRLDIRYCFINCPYDRMFTLKNISEVAGYLLYNETEQDMGLTCNLSLTESYIEPGETITIHLEIKGLELGLHTKNLNFTIFGQKPTTLCKLTCDVQGPVVCVNPEEIKFGSVQLLKWQKKTLHVMNDSPVSAEISISVASSNFIVNPSEFTLEASEKMSVEISIYLTYCARYSSVLILNIVNNSDPLRVPVTAVGIGCCVLFEPILEPQFNLGKLLTHNQFKVPFKMTNMGREMQKLCFSTVNNIRSMKIDPSTLKGHLFTIEPNILELIEKETKTGFVQVENSNPGPAELMYYCYTFDKSNKITKIFDVKLLAYFEDPALSLSKRDLHFRMDVTPYETDAYLEEIFTVTNETYLALDIYISLDPPFFLHDESGSLISKLNTNVPSKENFSFSVEFIPPSNEKRCNSSNGMMIIGFAMHPRTFHVPLIGDVHYPTVATYPDSIKNEQISPMANCNKEFILKNISPLIASYKFQWEVSSYIIEKLPTTMSDITLKDSICWNPSEDEATQYALECIFNESADNMTNFPSYDAVKESVLHDKRLPQFHPERARKMLRACNFLLGSLIHDTKDDENEYMKVFKHMAKEEQNINEAMLNVTPYQGCLEPFECSLVNFYLRPPPQTFIKATVKCQIFGGAEEQIEVSGVCGDIAFDIDRTEINFGDQFFCETLQTEITLTNTGYISFEYTIMDDSNAARSNREMDNRWLRVSPNIGVLEPGESVKLQVKYFPGATGEFREYFAVEIGYLHAVLVEVYGFGLYSQLSILLPRPNLFQVADCFFCYDAIAGLTNEGIKLHHNIKSSSEDSQLDETTKFILQKEDWIVVEISDENVPSLVDIDMAIERMIGNEYLQASPNSLGQINSKKKRQFTVPNFMVPPYEAPFGNVRIDVQYQQDVYLYNYGPGTCIMRLVLPDKKSFVNKGLTIVLDASRIKLHEFAHLSITYQPNSKIFNNQYTSFSQRIYIEVYHGAKIPIDITASIGIPVMEMSTHCMDFCGVVVGNCKRKTLYMYNNGFVEVNWKCSIDSSLFFVKEDAGVLYPEDTEELHIFFEPKSKGPRQAIITFYIEGSTDENTVYLNGYGLEPRLIVKETHMKFSPALQYSPASEQTFLIQNISGFRNEIFFTDYDRQISLHERIMRIFWKLKNSKKVYLAQACFGTIPSDMYNFLFAEVLLEMMKRGEDYTEIMKYSKTDIMESDDLMEKTLKTLEQYTENTVPKKSTQYSFIDLESQIAKSAEETKSNVIIVFYGNKFTDYLNAATTTSKTLQIPRYTLDGMIIDILVRNNSSSTGEVNKIIEDAYFARIGPDNCVCRLSAIEDKAEEIWRRMEVILSSDPVNKRAKPKSARKHEKEKAEKSEKSSAGSRSSKKVFATNTADTFQGIPEELITQILSQKMEQCHKMILESLDSIFLPNEQVALKCFLKAAKNATCVYFVFFTCTFEEHIALIKEENLRNQAERMKQKEYLKKKLLDINDYSNLPKEESDVVQEIREERKRCFFHKQTDLRARIQADLMQYNNQTKANDLKMFWEYMERYRYRTVASGKLPSRTLKFSGSQYHNLMFPSKGTRESKGSSQTQSSKGRGSLKRAKSKKGRSPRDNDIFYYFQFDVKLCEILHLLEHWDRKNHEMIKPFPNFASMMSSNLKNRKGTSKASKVSRARNKSVTSSLKITSEVDEVIVDSSFDPNIGYPVWLISQAHQKRSPNYIESIITLLNKMITMNCLTSTQNKCKDMDVMYSVLRKPSQRKHAEKSEVFELIKSETMEDDQKNMVDDDESISPTSSLSNSAKKRTRRKRLLLFNTELEQTKGVPVRFILEPGQIQEVTVLFKPLYIGSFKSYYSFEIVGTYYRHKVDVVAYCDYPTIDTSPNAMFPHLVQSVDSKTMFLNGIYVLSQQILDFGTLLFISHNLLKAKSTISMLNTSTMICYVDVTFRNESDTFFCEESDLSVIITPGRQHCLSVYAKPSREGFFKETLLIIIRNNPRIREINLSCYACSLKFEVNPKHINFSKVILGKTETEKVNFSNHTAVMVYFELDFDLSSEFTINSFNGYIEPCSVFELTITYTPEKIGDRKETIIVKIFDREKQYPEPVHIEVLTLFAEVATFCIEYPTNINLGLVKGKTPLFFPFTITNTGKYDVKVILTKPNDNFDTKRSCDYFKMKHMEYVVKGDSKYSNNCRFICNKKLSFKNVPIMDVMILDNYRNSAVDCFTLYASGKVILSKFELCPYGEYFLGYQNVNTKRSSILTLRNTGHFQFSYTILTPNILQEQSSRKKPKKEVKLHSKDRASSIPSIIETDVATVKSPTKSMRSTRSGSGKRRKPKSKTRSNIEELVAGVFTISPSRGTVQPKSTISITIYSTPTECRKYTESIVFFVSEANQEDHKGRILNIHVEGTEPSISFTDFEFMFPELHIAKTIEDLPYVGQNFVFETSKMKLNFGKIAVNTSVRTRFRIPNTGHVTATVHFEMREKGSDFTVASRSIDIAPYNSEFNSIYFSPKSIGIRSGILDIRCHGFSSGHILNQRIHLTGEACMPTIEILEPELRSFGDTPIINFNPTIVNEFSEKIIILKNNGSVPCRVIVEICEDPKFLLNLRVRNESEITEGDKELDKIIGTARYRSISLNTEEKAFVSLGYLSTSAEDLSALLNISVVNNCFDIWKLPVTAHSFYNEVSLENINTALDEESQIYYSLDFGYLNKNELYKQYFKIKNYSEKAFRFEFENNFGLTFHPRIGHLYGISEKNIVAAFSTNQNLNLGKEKFPVAVTEIQLSPEYPILAWDDRQDCSIFVATSSIHSIGDENVHDKDASYQHLTFEDILNKHVEPTYKIVNEPFQIPLFVSAQCAFSNYYCEFREIIFPVTYPHCHTFKTVYVENRSSANLKIHWTLRDLIPHATALAVNSWADTSELPQPESSIRDNNQILQDADEIANPNFLQEALTIEPRKCVISPDEEQEFKITFSPIKSITHEAILKANMENLNPETSDLEITLKGKVSYSPYQFQSTHLEDYKHADPRFKAFCGYVAEKNAKVLHFLALGISSKCNRTIDILNDTNSSITFSWKKVKSELENTSFFHCEKYKGCILPGKISQTNFTFIPQYSGTFTDSFYFTPDDLKLARSSILMIGRCREPTVYYEHPYLKMETALINTLKEEEIMLRNDEEESIHFQFKKSTLVTSDQQILSVFPTAGLIKPKSRNKIRFSSQSSKCGETIFNTKCVIEYMNNPIQLNVITNVIEVTSNLIFYSKELNACTMKPYVTNVINLGMIIPHKKEEIRFELQNTCTVGFYFSWTADEKQHKLRIQFLQEKGYLPRMHKNKFIIFFTALRCRVIKNTFLKLHILHGPSYIFRIEASADKPMYSFSFLKYDFGKCIIQKEPSRFYHIGLIFTNHNSSPVVIENGENGSSEFMMDFGSKEVKKNESITINIYFSPTEAELYKRTVIFFTNSKKVFIKLSGEGVPLALQILNSSEKFLNFGAVKVGKIVQKSVQILNSGKATVNAFFDLFNRLPFHKKQPEKNKREYIVEESTKRIKSEEWQPSMKSGSQKKKLAEKEKSAFLTKDEKYGKGTSSNKLTKIDPKKKSRDSGTFLKSIPKNITNSETLNVQMEEEMNNFLLGSFEIIPKRHVVMVPGSTVELIIKFKPKTCKEQFQTNVFFEVQNYMEPIVHLIGSAVDANFRLNKDVVAFGNVVVGYPNEETIVLINEGHIGGKFKWYLEKKSSYVSFIGGEGFSPPNSKVTTTVVFKPGHVQCFFRFKAYCKIENYDKHLNLLLTGGSMNVPPPLETIEFETAVREETLQNVIFRNETKEAWNSKPVFNGDYFSGNEVLHVPKESTASYEIYYLPMKFSSFPHKGSVFFPLPCGFSRLYSLKGIVSQPKPVKVITREITCKTYHTEVLKVENWLGLRQSFKVLTDVIEVDSVRIIYKITSNDLLEVPPHGSRDFKWTIYVLNEGKLSLKVTFLNEKSKEYSYYLIMLKISSSEQSIETIKLSTCVRIPVTKNIIITNPLHEALEYTTTTSCPNIYLNNIFTVPPYEKYQLPVKYLPVKVESTSVRLHIDNPQIGGYSYNLILHAHAPNLEPEVHFKAQLGQNASQTIFLSQELHNHDVNFKISESGCFEVLRINSQTENPYADIYFSPTDLGISRGCLHIFSYMGEHTYPLVGECVEPKPQGPLIIRYGDTISVDFTNPFEENKIFQFTVDNTFFQVQPLFENIKGKKSTRISVSAQSQKTSKQDNSIMSRIENMVTGKMSIFCEYENSPLYWIYYLQCEFPNK